MKYFAIVFLAFSSLTFADDKGPDCSGPDNWAPSMAYAQLKNDGLVSPETVDFTKTKVVRISSEKIGKDLYKQIHHVTFTLKSGGIVQVITVNDASFQECSMSDVTIYVVSKIL